MTLYDWAYYCIDNNITRSAAGYVVQIAETLKGSAQPSSKAIAGPPAQVATAVMKPLWKQAGNSHYFLRLAAVSGCTALCLGAYGAHRDWEGESKEDIEHRKKQFEVANQYHFYHTLALIAIPLARFPVVTGSLFTTGIFLFCGPIYYSSVSGDRTYNKLAPFGGVTFIIGWLSLIF